MTLQNNSYMSVGAQTSIQLFIVCGLLYFEVGLTIVRGQGRSWCGTCMCGCSQNLCKSYSGNTPIYSSSHTRLYIQILNTYYTSKSLSQHNLIAIQCTYTVWCSCGGPQYHILIVQVNARKVKKLNKSLSYLKKLFLRYKRATFHLCHFPSSFYILTKNLNSAEE